MLLLLVGVAALAVAVLAWGRGAFLGKSRARSPRVPAQADAFPVVPVSPSPFLNTRPEAQYVGMQACERCHPDTHQSYYDTMMSRSMSAVDPSREPPDGQFLHARSGRRYQIYRQGGTLRQSETLTGVEAIGDAVLADHPLKYVIGSGHFSRTYLAEVDGFLVEAPATWYATHAAWDMSPGYDVPFPRGFEREASENCLYCHAGRVETLEGTLHKIKVHEATIGCERCHGPGSLHVAYWETNSRTPAENGDSTGSPIDFTIVNPAHLNRELAEPICQQCHLTSGAQAPIRGRAITDYRPGLPLQDFFVSYRVKSNDESMKVVGHFDQLVQSLCYQKSGTLTCLTCHNPHAKPGSEERAAYYRSICLDCHRAADCRVDDGVRAARAADNDCTKCHMPGAPTEIVHLAFTHHRIGIHEGREPPVNENSTTSELEPWHDLSRVADVDRRRLLGLAWFSRSLEHGANSQYCVDRASELLEDVRDQGLEDGLVAAALAAIAVRTPGRPAIEFASEALADAGLPATARIGVLYLLAVDHYQNQRLDRAVELLEELTRLRRSSADWALLGICEQARHDSQAATAAFEKAVAINPQQASLHEELARLYDAAGDVDKATFRRRIGKRIQEIAKPGSERRQ
jgi:hypothetical protein